MDLMRTTMTYLLNKPITIIEYDRRWPLWYTEEQQCLLAVLHPLNVALEHIGSTSVPGLDAKPILDISAGLADREAISDYSNALCTLGYFSKQPQVSGMTILGCTRIDLHALR